MESWKPSGFAAAATPAPGAPPREASSRSSLLKARGGSRRAAGSAARPPSAPGCRRLPPQRASRTPARRCRARRTGCSPGSWPPGTARSRTPCCRSPATSGLRHSRRATGPVTQWTSSHHRYDCSSPQLQPASATIAASARPTPAAGICCASSNSPLHDCGAFTAPPDSLHRMDPAHLPRADSKQTRGQPRTPPWTRRCAGRFHAVSPSLRGNFPLYSELAITMDAHRSPAHRRTTA